MEQEIKTGRVELPQIKDDEILVKIMSDSICMSTYKLQSRVRNTKEHHRTSTPIRSSSDMNSQV